MMRAKRFAPNANLAKVDEKCGELDYVTGSFHDLETEFAMLDNFAFGGANTSLVFKRV